MTLTDAQIRTAKPGKKHLGDGLHLQVTKTGAKSWFRKYRRDGRSHEIGLGGYPAVSLAEAREENFKIDRLLALGIDPLTHRRAAKAKATADATTFEEVAKQYVKMHKAGWRNLKHAAQWTSTLETYVYPMLTKPLIALTMDDIHDVLTQDVNGKPLWEARTETASRIRQRIENIIDYAKVKNLFAGENPARWRGGLQQLLPKRSKVAPVKRRRALPYHLIGEFMTKLARYAA